MSDLVSSIKLKEIDIFLEVSRAKSIREVSRRLNLTPGQVSKCIQHLESKLGTKLYRRSVRGVLPTAQGSEFLEIAQDIATNSEKIKQLLSGQGKTAALVKTVAISSTSFLNTHLVTPAACRFAAHRKNLNFRFLDLAPDQLVPVALRGGFEVAVHYGRISWPKTWTTNRVGKSSWVLCAKFNHPISKRPTVRQVMEYPFVIPTYWTQEGLVKGNDQFPIPLSKRKSGFETATADAAVSIILETDQIAFLPRILVRTQLESKLLRDLKCSEIETVERELFLSVRSDLVSDSIFKGLAVELSQSLKF